jgi:uncharacterized protein YndB with AHSA1/START domain
MSNDEQDFRLELEIAAPREAVFQALSDPAAIAGWWEATVDGGDEVGETMRVDFGAGGWTEHRVDRLDRPTTIEWTCTAQDIARFNPTDEWVGTSMSFHLEPAGEEKTRLVFVHHGLRPLECIEVCERGWSYHLGATLKQRLESGVEEPA